MKKIKKLLAMIMAMTMVLGMSLTSFAAENAKITVKGLTPNDNTTVAVYEIMTWNESTNNWSIQDWANSYVTAPEPGETEYEIAWDDIYNAIKNNQVTATPIATKTLSGDATSCEFSNSLGLGAYFIYATGTKTVYNAMGVTTYEYADDDHLIGPFEATVYAKGASYDLTKEFSDEYNQTVAGIGDTVKYDIETTFPSFDQNSTDKVFTITDKPTGLEIINLEVFVGDMSKAVEMDGNYNITPDLPSTNNVTISFTEDYIGDNAHAAADVKVVVTAKVVDITYKNEVESSNYNNETPVTPVERETGSMEITKVDEEGNTLTGAEFEITKGGEKLYFTKQTDGSYKYEPNNTVQNRVSTLTVDASGKLKVTGLSGGEYTITETKAPKGYAITTPVTKTIVLAEQNEEGKTDNKVLHLVFDVVNTKLASLPSTGGIGTTIFTIGGCAIMIAAAALFFVSRRKSEEN